MGILVGVALVLTSLSTVYLMRSDLMTQVDKELQAVTEPVARQALRDPPPRRVAPADELRLRAAERAAAAAAHRHDRDPRAARPPGRRPAGHQWRAVHGAVRGVGRLQWRFVAVGSSTRNATFAVGKLLDTVRRHTVTRLLVLTGLIGTAVLVLSLVLARYAVRRAFRP